MDISLQYAMTGMMSYILRDIMRYARTKLEISSSLLYAIPVDIFHINILSFSLQHRNIFYWLKKGRESFIDEEYIKEVQKNDMKGKIQQKVQHRNTIDKGKVVWRMNDTKTKNKIK